MYHMIGGDDNEYGPVSADQLREWIAAGRADGGTKLRAEGSTDWKLLAQYPEFADALAGRAAAQTQAQAQTQLPPPGQAPLPPGSPATPGSFGPTDPGLDPVALTAQAIARNYEVNVGSVIGRAWELLTSDFWPIVGVSALSLVLLGLAGAAYVGILLNGPLLGGLFAYYLKRIRGQESSVNDIFAGFSSNFVQLMLGGLVSGLLSVLGFLCCIIPGVYLGIAWQLTPMLIQDRRVGFWEAMEVSRKVINNSFWGIFLLLVVVLLINLAGVLCCLVGTFVTVPLGMIALAYVYEDLFGSQPALEQTTPTDLAPTQPPS